MNNSRDSVSILYNQLELPHLDYGNQKLLEGGPLDYDVGVANSQHFFVSRLVLSPIFSFDRGHAVYSIL